MNEPLFRVLPPDRPARRLVGLALFLALGLVALASRATAPAGHYTITNGTVYDTKTKLTWQQNEMLTAVTLAGAGTYCSSLTLNAMTGWRVPTAKELFSLVDVSVAQPGPMIATTAFPSATSDTEWVSTIPSPTEGVGMILSFQEGVFGISTASTDMNDVRCVR
jgi:hypothetical protein